MVRQFDSARSRAVLIGVSRYSDMPDLPAVVNNLKGMAAVLTDSELGRLPASHCVVLDEQADVAGIGQALAEAGAAAEDMLLVYFSGHGVPGNRRGDLYLALAGTVTTRPAFSALAYDALREQVLDSRAGVRVIIIDCCFSGRAAAPFMSDEGSSFAEQLRAEGTYVLTASPANRPALSGPFYSEFTGELLRVLQDGIPGQSPVLTLDSIYGHLRKRMIERNLHKPQGVGSADAGQLALVPKRAYAAAKSLENPVVRSERVAGRERVLALGPLAPPGISAVRSLPAVPTYVESRPKSVTIPKESKSTAGQVYWTWAERRINADMQSLAQRDALNAASTDFGEYVSRVRDFCLGPHSAGSGDFDGLADQVPGWASIVERIAAAASIPEFRSVTATVDRFIADHYRVFPYFPPVTSVKSRLRWFIKLNCDAQWGIFSRYLHQIMAFEDQRWHAAATTFTEVAGFVGARYPELKILLAEAEQLSEITTSITTSTQRPKLKANVLAARIDTELAKLTPIVASMDEILRRRLAEEEP